MSNCLERVQKEVEFLRVGRFLDIIASALEKQKLKRPDYEGDGCDCEGDIIFDTWICSSFVKNVMRLIMIDMIIALVVGRG